MRYVVIGVAGANYYALGGSQIFTTKDRDLFLPLDPDNLLGAWEACAEEALELWAGTEPLGGPRDRWLAQRIVDTRSVTRASDRKGLEVDLSLTMAGFDFDTVWRERRTFLVEGVEIPVARLSHIVQSKAAAGRPKDQLFLATHAEALRELLGRDS